MGLNPAFKGLIFRYIPNHYMLMTTPVTLEIIIRCS